MADIQDGKFAHHKTVPPESNRVLNLFSLHGKTAIVSGAAAGIGLAIAQGFAEAGANVAIWYNTQKEKAEKAAVEIEKDYPGVKCKAYQVNVTSFAQVQTAIETIVGEFNNRLDIFVANSGIAWEDGPMLDGPAEDRIRRYKQIVDTNLDGTFHCARVAGTYFRKQKQEGTVPGFTYGSFIATASMSGSIVNIPQLQAAYNASKAGVIHLVRSLAVEWVGFARANTVSPGYIVTEISKFCSEETKKTWRDKIPMGREGMPNELKGAYLYLASDASSYTTAIDLVVDGGYCAP
ncbi:putative sorbose reductase SOU1 [Podospora fimiseda]|uniref:Sorbose reductase SOU1 n=1 Tax=Podospora fimiseda TaxID=252190 RepID=A0AAN7BPI1_9PEZI|nr:putative sorbose reductase SOU1 [Podospora fimiseda]